jgi:NAD(P)-dependent dehydrogenase (short-subunit alcohol dehydrogenase family)
MIRIPEFGFDGQVVLITGATSGIGREAAIAFAKAGADLVLVARRASVLAKVAKETRALGSDTLTVPTDVSKAAEVKACFGKAKKRFGRIDLVINNAGVLIPSPVVEIRRSDFQAMLNVNLFGAMHVMQAAVPLMREQGHGHIVNVGSLAGRRGFSPLGAYSATKFALVGLTEALRTELVGENIHISLVLPSVVDTPMAAVAQASLADLDGEQADVWPDNLNLPTSWVVTAIFAAVKLRLTEVAVPPGAGLIEKLAALTPGATDKLLRWTTDTATRAARRRRDG